MTERQSDRDASAEEWLNRARVDVEDARTLFNMPRTAYNNVSFLCQQAAEKVIKAFLVANQVAFPRTHDIRTLLVGSVARIDPELALEARFADELTPYAIEGRYPLGFELISREHAEELLATLDRAWALFEPRVLALINPAANPQSTDEATLQGDLAEGENADEPGHE